MRFLIITIILILGAIQGVALDGKEIADIATSPPDHYNKAYQNVLLYKQHGISVPLRPDDDPNALVPVWNLSRLSDETNVTAVINVTVKKNEPVTIDGNVTKRVVTIRAKERIPAMWLLPGPSILMCFSNTASDPTQNNTAELNNTASSAINGTAEFYGVVRVPGQGHDDVVRYDPTWRTDPVII